MKPSEYNEFHLKSGRYSLAMEERTDASSLFICCKLLLWVFFVSFDTLLGRLYMLNGFDLSFTVFR